MKYFDPTSHSVSDLKRIIGLSLYHHKSVPKALCTLTVTFRRHEAANGRTHADDARTATHDASPSPHDDASQARNDATGQIRASGFSPFFVAMNRLCLVRTLGLTLGFINFLKIL